MLGNHDLCCNYVRCSMFHTLDVMSLPGFQYSVNFSRLSFFVLSFPITLRIAHHSIRSLSLSPPPYQHRYILMPKAATCAFLPSATLRKPVKSMEKITHTTNPRLGPKHSGAGRPSPRKPRRRWRETSSRLVPWPSTGAQAAWP